MITVVAGGRRRRPPMLAALGAVAVLVLAGCSIAGQEPDAGGGDQPPAGVDDAVDASGATGAAPARAPGPGDDSRTGVPSPISSPSEPSDDGVVPDDDTTPEEGAPDEDGIGEPPPFYANTLPDYGEQVGGGAGVLTDIRTDVNPGFDRVVLEFDGRGVPEWHVRYVDFVIGDPGGDTLEIAGAGVLEVTLVGVDDPDHDPAAYDGPSRLGADGSTVVTEVLLHSVLDGQLQAFVGVDPRELPFRAYRLTEPSRVVIEVQHPR